MSNTDTRVYVSIFGAEKPISAAQYIAEIITSRLSKFLKVNLPDRFWSNDAFLEWTKKYLMQLRKANSLNRSGYPYEVILAAINSSSCRYVCTLNNKKLDFLLSEELRKHEEKVAIRESVPESATNLEPLSNESMKKVENTSSRTKIS